MTLRITCDDYIQELYLDGVKIPPDGNIAIWNQESTFEISDTPRVIALKCLDYGAGDGILASLENESGDTVFYTDTKWKCSSVFENDWQVAKFKATSVNWRNSVKRRDHGGDVGKISTDADWIWTNGDQDTVYCRGRVFVGKFLVLFLFLPQR